MEVGERGMNKEDGKSNVDWVRRNGRQVRKFFYEKGIMKEFGEEKGTRKGTNEAIQYVEAATDLIVC